MAYKILGNDRCSGNMVWTLIFIDGISVRSDLVIGPASESLCLKLAQEEYESLLAIIPGHNMVVFPKKNTLDILLTN